MAECIVAHKHIVIKLMLKFIYVYVDMFTLMLSVENGELISLALYTLLFHVNHIRLYFYFGSHSRKSGALAFA